MGHRRLGALMLVACACGAQLAPGQVSDQSDAGGDGIVQIDLPDADTSLGPWGPAVKLPGASTTGGEDDGGMSSTMLEMVFSLREPEDGNRKHIYYMSRTTPTSEFSTPIRLPFNVTGSSDETARFSSDDLTIYFTSGRGGVTVGMDVYQVSRPALGGEWGTPTPVTEVNTDATDKWYTPCGNEYVMSQANDLAGGTVGSAPKPLTALNSTGEETGVFLTPDCLTLYFASTRSGTYQIYRTRRGSLRAPWGNPAVVSDFAATGGAQSDPWMSADQRTFLFTSNVDGNDDVYMSTR
jgi:hypothetical protein